MTNTGCYGYQMAGRSVAIRMGGTKYVEGFQVSTTGFYAATTWTWTRQLGGRYCGFALCVGLAAAGDTEPAITSFVGPNGGAMTFRRLPRDYHL